jgi:hypothetical protein
MCLKECKHRQTILKLLFNRKHKKDHYVMENAFGILKKLFEKYYASLNYK